MIKQFIADAFTDKIFHGNPAAICLPERWPDDKLMQDIASENNLSETAFVYEEMKGRPVMVDDIKPSTDGNGMTIAVDPKKLMGIGNTGGKKPTSHIPAASRAAGAALEGVAGMYAGSSYPLEPNQPVILGRDPAYAKIVFSQGAQKISRRHCEVMFNSQVQKYRVTDFSSINGHSTTLRSLRVTSHEKG